MHQLPRFQRQRLTSEHLSVVWLEVPPKTHCTGLLGSPGARSGRRGPAPPLAGRAADTQRALPAERRQQRQRGGGEKPPLRLPLPRRPLPRPRSLRSPPQLGVGREREAEGKRRREGAGRRGAERAEGGGGACRALRSLRRPQRKPPDSAQAAEAPRPGAGGPCHPTDVRARQAELG
ncbi:unnamed protein product [Prorocentrum cordatum]|uniref:Uncharacterized protein n=1 Tax=Prorocentrum cordatum TaxID=2364126 RepID=A0ABN9U940_9DINO|nr:unnamed protein product [Polarella glacialis]